MEKKEYILPQLLVISLNTIHVLNASANTETDIDLGNGGGGNGTGPSEPHGIDVDFEL
jgi:hypothetical protein